MTEGGPAPFRTLYYTDCRPGQGLGGGAGFQFQARSPGVGEAEQRLVARTALYEVPTSWMRERRPVEAYPRSLAHLRDGVFVTAAGRYLGQEANGYRDGNQFTHALVTEDESSYGLARPAQLWGAPWWVGAPAPTTASPPVPAAPETGPWDTETVRERVAASPDGRARLLALVTALGAPRDPERRRVLLVTDRGEEAACWLAAATLLLDRARALAVSFKIFATDPSRSPHDVVAAHPDWAEEVRRQGRYAVFDLPAGEVPDLAPSPEARFWVPLFLGADDPLDVVDAVELAGQLARAGRDDGVPGEAEREAAALAVGLPLADGAAAAPRTARWLRGAGSRAAELLGATAVEALVAGTDDHAALVDLDDVVAERAGHPGAAELGWDRLATTTRARLFDREVERAHQGVPDSRLRPLPAPDRDEALDHVARTVDPAAALTLAHRHGLRVPDVLVRRFVAWWADHPDADVDPPGWDVGPAVVTGLYQELERRLGDRDRRERTVADVARRWWRHPAPLADRIPVLGPTGPQRVGRLDTEVARAAFRDGPEARAAALRGVAAAVLPGPRGPWVSTWEKVLGTRPVDNAAVARFLEATPPAARDRPLAVVAYHSLTRAPAVDQDTAAALAVLEAAGLPPRELGFDDWPPVDPAVVAVVERLGRAPRLEEARELGRLLTTATRPSREDQARLVRALRGADPSVSGRVLAATRPSALRTAVLDQLHHWAAGTGQHAPDVRSTAVLFAFALKERTDRPRIGAQHQDRLATARDALGERGRDDVAALLADDEGELDLWRKWRPSRARTAKNLLGKLRKG
ncbi:GAP1-N2 domain-containing protein [Actinomycetospora lemnae]|uniref:HEAT repeat protein n=1 Tax=Actinomycetospora lemnae TaxID=3019891 RepID=A0ABT5SZH4_9PSEU|nr:hypothetical protein [Actinomycetospora sp. DW7H6]MDD7968257.1 hypothetical protein [Actinomycetospora sp. DW7H6]